MIYTGLILASADNPMWLEAALSPSANSSDVSVAYPLILGGLLFVALTFICYRMAQFFIMQRGDSLGEIEEIHATVTEKAFKDFTNERHRLLSNCHSDYKPHKVFLSLKNGHFVILHCADLFNDTSVGQVVLVKFRRKYRTVSKIKHPAGIEVVAVVLNGKEYAED